MSPVKVAFVILAIAVLAVYAKPSPPYGFDGFQHSAAPPDHFDFAPPVLPPAEFHTAHHSHLIPAAQEPIWAAEELIWAAPPPPPPAYLPAPFAPAVLPAPEPYWPAPATYLPQHFLPAPAPLLPAPAPLPITKVLPPVYEAVAFAPPPSYRATFGPKTTTHHISVGYAFPQPTYAKVIAPHAHLHAAPLSFSHHHHHLKSLW